MTAAKHPLADKLLAGDVRALSRVCRLVDDGVGEYRAILKQLFPHTGHAWTIGVTGMPGAGKSTLTNELIACLRAQDKRVAVLAIDPTSPFSGGAILGDRIRMTRHHADPEVFIRSLATRGALGGLSRSAADLVRVCDAWKADVVLVETVGVGQDELEVTRTADTTLVVMAPGMGDDVQAIKAGILECADVFAVNKADREGADATARDLQLMIALGQRQQPTMSHAAHHAAHHKPGPAGACGPAPERDPDALPEQWEPPIVRCVATKNQGVAELVRHMEVHHRWLRETEAGASRRRQRLREATKNQLRNTLLDHAEAELGESIEAAVDRIDNREVDPYTAAEELVAAFQSSRT